VLSFFFLIIGEQLGMHLKVEQNGSVIVTNVVESGAAYRASELNGTQNPIRVNDEITEINGVLLTVSLSFLFLPHGLLNI
jgi:C-terminal processing protease CtpA/Prc